MELIALLTIVHASLFQGFTYWQFMLQKKVRGLTVRPMIVTDRVVNLFLDQPVPRLIVRHSRQGDVVLVLRGGSVIDKEINIYEIQD